MRRLGARDLAASAATLAALLALWWAASHGGWLSPVFLPTPEATVRSLAEGLAGGELASFSVHTLERMLLGFGLATVAGVTLGCAVGLSPALRAWIGPTLEFVRPLPASAVMPLAIALFGLSDGMVLTVVTFGSMWPVLLATVHGLAAVHERLHEVARALELGRGAFVLKIGLPNALPDIVAGMRLALTVSLIVSVVGEMIASQPGLGQAILLAARAFRASELFAGIALLGALGLASNALLALVERRLLAWQHPD